MECMFLQHFPNHFQRFIWRPWLLITRGDAVLQVCSSPFAAVKLVLIALCCSGHVYIYRMFTDPSPREKRQTGYSSYSVHLPDVQMYVGLPYKKGEGQPYCRLSFSEWIPIYISRAPQIDFCDTGREKYLKNWRVVVFTCNAHISVPSLPRVLSFKFPLQPHQNNCISQYEELGFS